MADQPHGDAAFRAVADEVTRAAQELGLGY
jgi:hypothetical protein